MPHIVDIGEVSPMPLLVTDRHQYHNYYNFSAPSRYSDSIPSKKKRELLLRSRKKKQRKRMFRILHQSDKSINLLAYQYESKKEIENGFVHLLICSKLITAPGTTAMTTASYQTFHSSIWISKLKINANEKWDQWICQIWNCSLE